MPLKPRKADAHAESPPKGNVVQYHKRYALLQLVVFLVVVAAFFTLILKQNRRYEQYDLTTLTRRFERHVRLVDNRFADLRAEIIELQTSAQEDLFESRYAENLSKPLAYRFLKNTADGQAFHLDDVGPPLSTETIGNLTGDGTLEGRSPDFYREIAMALRLSGDFVGTAKTIPNLTWLYYYSKDNFATYFPWVLSTETRFEKESYKLTAWTLGLPEINPEHQPYWTETYFDSVGKGLMTSCLAPVYDEQRFVGVVGGDLSVAFLNELLAEFEPSRGGTMVLYDQFDNLLGALRLITAGDEQIRQLDEGLPEALAAARDRLGAIPPGTLKTISGWRVLRADLLTTPFHVLYFEPEPTRAAALVEHLGVAPLALLGGLAVILLTSLTVTHLGFVRPSERFVRHVLAKSQGERSNPDARIPQVWRPWFQAITRVFDDNAALTDQLRVRNQEMRQEIQERRRAEEALATSEARLQAILDNIPDWVWLKDLDSRYIMMNKSYAKALGIEPEKAVGKTDSDLWPRELAEKYCADDRKVVESQAPMQLEEFVEQGSSGPAWLDTVKIPICDAQGEIIGTVGIARDITARKQAEEEKHRLESQLRQSQKMEVVGQLAGGVAHDFNNLLTSILGNAEMAIADLSDTTGVGDENPAIRAALEQIHKAGERGASLTRQLLMFSRKQMPQIAVLHPNTVINEMDEMLRRLIGEHISIEKTLAPDLHGVRGDKAQVEQAIMNLVLNARDAMPRGGCVSITTSNVTLDRGYASSHIEARPGPHVLIRVSDTGEGMSEDILGHLFEPFFTTKPIGKGTGLGLATVYGVVRQANGHVTVESKPGQGSVFSMYFPAIDPGESPADVAITSEKVGGHETVLLCEDEEMVRRLASTCLAKDGYSVIEAEDGKRALEASAEHEGPIHLLITDLVMPGMNGRDLERELKKHRPELRVILMSGYTADVIDEEGVLKEHAEFLQKPFTLKDFAQRVREVLDKPTE